MPGTRLSWDGGLNFATDGAGGFEPAIDPPPAALPERVIVAEAIDSVVVTGTEVAPVVRSVSRTYPRHRIVVGGKDVTYFRGVQTPMPTYGLESPLLYGSGLITFPQVHAAYERPGQGALSWLKKFSRVKVQRVDPDGDVLHTDYIGFIADFRHDGRELSCTLGGQAAGLAAMIDRPVPIFPKILDIAGPLKVVIQHRLRMPTGTFADTGIKLAETGGGSQLDYLAETLALSTQKDGDQWTIMPNSANGRYHLFQKDLTTIDASVYIDGFHVVESLRRDFTEEPNRIWAQGVDSDGRRIRFAIFPGLVSGERPAFPGTLSPGDTGDDVVTLKWRLYVTGYLTDPPGGESWTLASDDPITEAVEDLQADADLTVTGVVNNDTWNAAFDVDVTGYSLTTSMILPAAQKGFTHPFRRSASGQVIGQNPAYDRTKPLVDATVDMGFGFTRRKMHKWAKRELFDPDEANWVGTITVNTGGIIEGEHNPGDPLTSTDIQDVRGMRPGQNLWLANWHGGTLAHISGVQVSPGAVEFAVDTRGRDTMKVWEVIHRNRESRKSPARQWIAQNRRSGMRDDTAFYDGAVFGKVERTFCPAGEWTVVPTPAGRSGTLNLIDIQTSLDASLFGMAIFGKKVSSGWCQRNLGDPFTNGYEKHVQKHTKSWQDSRWLVDVFGWKDQPCGYWPHVYDPNDIKLVDQSGTAQAAGNTITISTHGYHNGQKVYFETGHTPAGLTANNDYYVVQATTNTFKVSATSGGSVMDITADNASVTVNIHVADTPPVTGQFRFKAGAPYFCVGSPVLWIGIRPLADCYLNGGRVLELLLDDSAG